MKAGIIFGGTGPILILNAGSSSNIYKVNGDICGVD